MFIRYTNICVARFGSMRATFLKDCQIFVDQMEWKRILQDLQDEYIF